MTLVLSVPDIVRAREEAANLGLLARHESWPRVALSELVDIQNGFPFKSTRFNNAGIGTPLIRIRDVGKDRTDTWYEGEFDSSFLVHRGDLLIGMDGDFRLSRWKGVDALLNQRVCRVSMKSTRVLSKFIEHVVPGYLEAIWQETSSVTVKHLSSRTIGDIPIPLPPLDEQEKIVEILDEQLSRLDAASVAIEAVRIKADRFRRSLLHSAFSGALTGHELSAGACPAGWKSSLLGDVARWSSGGTPKSGTAAYYGGPIPWAVIGDLTESWVKDTAQSITQVGLENSSAKVVQPGTVLLAMYGASIGRTGIAAVELATNQAIACAVPVDGTLDAQYLLKYLQSQKDDFVRAGQGGAQPNISQTVIKTWPVLLPPIEEQVRIVDILEQHLARLNATMAVADAIAGRISALRRSLLHAALTGVLTRELREGTNV